MGSCTSRPTGDDSPASPASPSVPLPDIPHTDMRYYAHPGPSHSHSHSHSHSPSALSDPGSTPSALALAARRNAPALAPLSGPGGGGRAEDKGKQRQEEPPKKLDLATVNERLTLKTAQVLEGGRGTGIVNEHGYMEAKILLLGSGESGKSTILKQMKIIHGGGFTPAELRQYRQIVRHNLVDSAQQLLRVILQWGYRPELGDLPPGWDRPAAEAEEEVGRYGLGDGQAQGEGAPIVNLPGTEDFSVPIRLPDEEDEGALSAGGARGRRPRAQTRDSGPPDQPVSFEDMMTADATAGRDWGRGSVSSKRGKKRRGEVDQAAAAAAPPLPGQAQGQGRANYDPRAARSTFSVSQTSTISDYGYPASSPTTSAFQLEYDRPGAPPAPRGQGSLPTIMTSTSASTSAGSGSGPGAGGAGAAVRALLDFQLQDGKNVPPWIAQAILTLWTGQPFMPEILKRSNEFYLMDNAPYFFKNTLRICDKEYWPTNRDVLRSRVQTRGVTESRFVADRMHIHMYDVGGQRAERKKWIYAFEKVKCVIFTVALSEYDQTLLENPEQNRMQESMKLFENIIASRWFQNAVFVLFFNKMDVFEEKYQRSPLKDYFPEYSGPNVLSGVKYIIFKYIQLNRTGVRAYSHITTATDTKRIEILLASVRENILDTAIKSSGLI